MRCLAAASATTRPTVVEPVKKMWSQRSASSAVVSSTPPSTTTTASGSTYCGSSRASAAEQAGRELRRLGQHAVARRQRGAERLDEELDRVVPRRDHEGHAERLGHDPTLGRRHGGRHAHLGGLHPARRRAWPRWRSSCFVWPMSAANASTFGRPRSAAVPRRARPRPPPSSGAARPAAPPARPGAGSPAVEGGPQLLVQRGRSIWAGGVDRHGQPRTEARPNLACRRRFA